MGPLRGAGVGEKDKARSATSFWIPLLFVNGDVENAVIRFGKEVVGCGTRIQ